MLGFMEERSPTPEDRIEELARACVVLVRDDLGFELDFTAETLPVLDHFCRRYRTGPDWSDRAEEIAATVGVYFGEVLRRKFPFRWHVSEKGYHAWRLELEPCFLCFNPLGVALELLLEGDALGWNACYLTWPDATEALRTRLGRMDQVSEEDFYAFSVRYEVLEAVADFLAGWTAQDPPRVYDSRFYDDQIAARREPEIVFTVT
jgi:hypothetical protein